MMRSVLGFFSMLAIGVMMLAVAAAIQPWIMSRLMGPGLDAGAGIHFQSAFAGLSLGLLLGVLARFHWADAPRRIVTWFLVRERQFFYYALIAGCIGVLLFY
ncbi:MAG: hypothetical protein ABL907_08975 [Hyphomicrobium sp.]